MNPKNKAVDIDWEILYNGWWYEDTVDNIMTNLLEHGSHFYTDEDVAEFLEQLDAVYDEFKIRGVSMS